MSTIIAPTPAQWAVLEALGLTQQTSFLIIPPYEAGAITAQHGISLHTGQAVEACSAFGEDEVFITFISADHYLMEEIVEELLGKDDEDDEGDEDAAEADDPAALLSDSELAQGIRDLLR